MKKLCKSLLADKTAVILDTETTGLDGRAQLVQIAIVSIDGDVLLDSFVKPIGVDSWPQAQQVHGITPEMVKDAPTIMDLEQQIKTAVWKHQTAVYNAEYDRRILTQSVYKAQIPSGDFEAFQWLFSNQVGWVDIMEPYAGFWGDWNQYHGSNTWQSLTAACRQQGVEVKDAHAALGDCLMTLELIKAVAAKKD